MDTADDLLCTRYWSLVATAFLIIAVGALVTSLTTKRPYKTPPGPLLLPFVGNLYMFLKDDPLTIASKLREQYGDIFSFYVGSRHVVVICGLPLLKEAYVQEASIFSDRPPWWGLSAVPIHKGISLSNGNEWKEQKRFMISTLSDLGMGTQIMGSKITREIIHMKDGITALNDRPFYPRDLVLQYLILVITGILFNKRFENNDPLFREICDCMVLEFKVNSTSYIPKYIPFADKIPGDIFKLKVNSRLSEIFRHLIKQSKDNLCADRATFFVNEYLLKIQQDATNGISSSFCDENMFTVVQELVFAATETTLATSLWFLLFLAIHQDVQNKVHEEIDAILGDSEPTYDDRLKLPYLEATIMETQRLADIAPIGALHSTSNETYLNGFRIPKGVTVIPFMKSVMHDPEMFPGPDKFQPEIFLNVDKKRIKDKGFIPFGIGKRSCPGELLANMELFLFAATIMQHFKIVFPDGYEAPPLQCDFSHIKMPPYFNVKAIRRDQMFKLSKINC